MTASNYVTSSDPKNHDLAYDIQPDLDDQAQAYFKWVLGFTVGVAGVMFGFFAVSNNLLPVPWLWLGLFIGLSFFAYQRKRLNVSIDLYFVAIIGVFTFLLAEYGPTPTQITLLMIPIIVASLVAKKRLRLVTAAVVILEVLVVSSKLNGFFAALPSVIVPITINILLVFVSQFREADILDTVYWATDIQKKDRRRAESFYQQREELNAALLQLAHTHSKLETINAQLAQTNIDLAAAREKADRVSQAKSVFLSNMSHELRTPLNVIIGYSSSMLRMPQMFQHVPMPEIYKPFIQLIEDNGHYLVGLINDVLDLSKIEAGKLELHPTNLELPELLRGIISTSIGLIKDKPLTIRPDFPDDLPSVWADPMRVRQVLLNLMSNAIKFTHTGSITLSAQRVGDMVSISVIDTGIGIAESAQRAIFDRFQQAAQNIEVQYGGTGLGLDISKQLSLMHGGDLTVSSVVGQGSTFTLTLPLAAYVQPELEHTPDGELAAADLALEGSIPVSDRNCFVLVAEDEVNSREFIKQTLENNGYRTIHTHDGQEVVEFAAGFLPDLIILDAHLPTLSGWKALKVLKDQPETAHIPVIIYAAEEHSDMAATLGAALFIQKPTTAELLLERVEQITVKAES